GERLFWLGFAGAHTPASAAGAIATARLVGVERGVAIESLEAFDGVRRRFEHRGDAGGAAFFDDYGQTPTEMEVTVATARRRRPERLIALVPPHRDWRVPALWRGRGAGVPGADPGGVARRSRGGPDPSPG